MNSSLVRPAGRRSLALLAVAALTFAAACGGDEVGASKLKSTHSGMARNEVLDAMGTGILAARGADTARLVNGHRRQSFFLNGRMIEVVWYRDQPGSLQDSILPKTDTPVIFTNDTLAGWGWKYYLGEGAKLGLVDPRVPAPRSMDVPTTTTIVPGAPDTAKK